MINITKHCYFRYAERIKNVPKDELEKDITFNKDMYHIELNKMFENSRLIYTGRFNDKHSETNFRISDNIILITDKSDSKIITLYRVEFGFDRDVDIVILKSLIDKLETAEDEYIRTIGEVTLEKDRVITSRDNLQEEIKELEDRLKIMKESLFVMNNYIDKFSYKEKIAKSEMETIAKKIVYSNIYRKEMEECL